MKTDKIEYASFNLDVFDKSQLETLNNMGMDGWILIERYVFDNANHALCYRVVRRSKIFP